MSEAGNSAGPWRSAKLGLLMFAVFLACLAAAALTAFQIIFPALGFDPDDGVLLLEEPFRAALVLSSVLFATVVVCYGSAILGAWIAKKHFPLQDVEIEFLRLLWLPGMRTANTRLFRFLFSSQADV
jgi:hypothetical protein